MVDSELVTDFVMAWNKSDSTRFGLLVLKLFPCNVKSGVDHLFS